MNKKPTFGGLLRQTIPKKAFKLTIQHLNQIIEKRLKKAWEKHPCPSCNQNSIKTWQGCDRIYCKNCHTWLTYTYNTPFYQANLEPGEILLSFILYADSLLSINQIAHLLNRPYKTTYNAIRRTEDSLKNGFPHVWKRVKTPKGPTKIDETQISCSGYKGKNSPRESLKRKGPKKPGRNYWTGDKGDEMTLIGTHRGFLTAIHADKSASSNKLKKALNQTQKLSKKLKEVHTDNWKGYKSINIDFTHKTVNHTKEYVNKQGIHTNQIENLWSLLKPWLAKFRGLSKTGLEKATHTFGIIRSLNLVESPIHGVIDCLFFNSLRQT